ncbi:MAG: HEAT repeat domain-containing protein [Planctomycetia bacterium]|nr:HEAT repeat domain-containing protein [Planctomycetia bacterium]
MRRRAWLTAMLLMVAGCSGKATKARAKKTGPSQKRPKGPQTMGGLLLDAYIEDLKSPAPDKRINAARELANMGPNAKKAVPSLEKMATDKNGKVSAAAKQALASIRK